MRYSLAVACSVLALLACVHSAPQPTNVGLGGNVDWFCGACDYYAAAVFTNAFKQSRGFGHYDEAWNYDGFTFDSVTGMPINQTMFGALLFWDLPYSNADTVGTWTIRVTGANVTSKGSRLFHCCTDMYNHAYNGTTKVYTANFNCTDPCQHHDVNFQMLDPSQSSESITNIEVIRPGYPLENYPMFTNTYLNFMRGFNTFRFMDWAQTNGNSMTDWSQRPTLKNVQFTRGPIPWEAAITLANTLGTNMWVNIPSNATDDYITQMAKLFKQMLDPNLIVYVEWSNEPWNSQFSVTQDSYRIGPMLYATGNYDFLDYDKSGNKWYVAYRWVAWRAMLASNIWRSVWGDEAMMTRVRPVLNGQGWSVWADTSLPMIDQVFGPPSKFFYALAIAPYFGMLNNSADDTEEHVWEQMDLGATNIIGVLTANIHAAKRWGLELVCYEGGADVGNGNSVTRAAVNLDPRMRATVSRYLASMFSAGVRLFNYYFLGANPFNGANNWGVVDSMLNTTEPKYQALRDILNAGKADYEYPYIPAPGIPVLTPNYSYVPQSEQGWPTSWDTSRWNVWEHMIGENSTNGGVYKLVFDYFAANPINLTLLVNNKLAGNFIANATNNTQVNRTMCTFTVIPRTNVLSFFIPNFPVPGGSIYFVRFERVSDAPKYTYAPQSYPPASSTTAASSTAASSTAASSTATSSSHTKSGSASTASAPPFALALAVLVLLAMYMF